MLCPSCGGGLPEVHRFCPSCGAPVGSASQTPTLAVESPAGSSAAAAIAIAAPVGRLVSSDSLPVGGFTPGMVLADRYRFVGLIGRGGMGEVYRADDLKLGQPIALKFLPKALADDPVRRERLFAEVRIARQVSHPNICRVYDIGELEGRHFLTMEYIDGEDLASLLKRIGNLHGAKALDVARQLCAGLAAAHDKGVLHRDLKPANVMIDGRGRARITDFGLAVTAGEEMPETDISGTPPYMAPEQFAGKGASVRSDIYALGLVFYEIYTGRRAFEARTMAELRLKKETSTPTAPSEIVRDIDPIAERVILRCIDKDPRQRPASAAQVAAAFPGGDPLAAAIAAGETPSPEMVAASGSTEGLKPWIAWTWLVLIILALGAAIVLKRHYSLTERVPMENSPEALVLKAREILKNVGYPAPPASNGFGFGFVPNYDYFGRVEESDQTQSRFDRLPASAVSFWYRQSPRPIVPVDSSFGAFGSCRITAGSPPVVQRGESVLWLDPRGNLTGLISIPPDDRNPAGAVQTPDWSVLFEASGMDKAKCSPTEPDSTYLAYDDTRVAWTGTLPDRPDIPVRIDAAARNGRPVLWRLTAPFRQGDAINRSSSTDLSGTFIYYFISMPMLILCGAFFARRNLRMGRGDRRGAARLACFILFLHAISWIFSAHHVAAGGEASIFYPAVAHSVFVSGLFWLIYIALEPFVRRRWPDVLIGWNRLLAGSFRDPLVGRDLLVGCGLGAAGVVGFYLGSSLTSLFGAQEVLSASNNVAGFARTIYIFDGIRSVIDRLAFATLYGIFVALGIGFFIFLARILVRKTWVATAIFVLMLCAIYVPHEDPYYLAPFLLLLASQILAFFRFGLLAAAAGLTFLGILLVFPITTQQSAYHFGIGLTGLVVLLAFALYAFCISLGDQPLFGRASLED